MDSTAPGAQDQPRRQSGTWAGIGGVPADRRYTAIKERPRAWVGKPLFAGDDIELFVVITAYKECAAQIDVSLQGVQQGIKDLMAMEPEGRTDTKLFGPDAWKHIAVCVVCDGRVRNGTGKVFIDDGAGERAFRSPFHTSSDGAARETQTWTRPQFFKEKYGLWDARHGRNEAAPYDDGTGVPTECHLFEATIDREWMAGKRELNYFREELLDTPMKVMLAVKEENKASKLDSHLWFLRGFATKLNPTFLVFVDAGTEPRPSSISSMVCAMLQDDSMAGCCGEIVIEKRSAPADMEEAASSYYTNVVVAAQKFEYKVSHLLDKTLDSLFGFIPVLPGAFSAYRWDAISRATRTANGHVSRPSPLYKYFEGEEGEWVELHEVEKSKRELSKAIKALTKALHEEEEHAAADTSAAAAALVAAAVNGEAAPSITRSSDAIHRMEFRQDAVKAAVDALFVAAGLGLGVGNDDFGALEQLVYRTRSLQQQQELGVQEQHGTATELAGGAGVAGDVTASPGDHNELPRLTVDQDRPWRPWRASGSGKSSTSPLSNTGCASSNDSSTRNSSLRALAAQQQHELDELEQREQELESLRLAELREKYLEQHKKVLAQQIEAMATPVLSKPPGLATANMYLAEDRILCYELVACCPYPQGTSQAELAATRPKAWTMAFISGAQGFVDPVTDLNGILKQRRRWLNGSFFATMFYLRNMWADVLVGNTAHTMLQRIGFLFQWLYTWLTTIMTLTLLSNFYLTLHYAVFTSAPNTYISAAVDWAYCSVFLAQTVASMSEKGIVREIPDSRSLMELIYLWSSRLMGAISLGVFALLVFQAFRGSVLGNTDTVFHGYEKFDCNVDRFNSAVLQGNGKMCGYTAGDDSKFAAVQAAFIGACSDANSHWKLRTLAATPGGDGLLQVVPNTAAQGCSVTGAWLWVAVITSIGCFFLCGALHAVFPRYGPRGLQRGRCVQARLKEFLVIPALFLQYVYMLPTFINIIMIFSFCNLHDLSWGTKGLEHIKEEVSYDTLCGYGKWTKKELRSLFIFVVLVVNGAWVAFAQRWVDGTCFLTGLAYFVGYYNGVKVVSSVVFFARPFVLHAWRVVREACHGIRERRAATANADVDEMAVAATPVVV